MSKRKGEAPALDIADLTNEQIGELVNQLRKAKIERRTPEQRATREAKKATVKERAANNHRRNVKRKVPRGLKRKGVAPAVQQPTDVERLLKQMSETFGAEWGDNPENPAVEVICSESHICARINVYTDRKWSARRLGDDNVIVNVKLKDGTEETRRFTRSVLSAEWKRC
jgi:hypothetical protein